ncbi:preprotein translocase subunit SecY [Candidatus Saccharibacteria bacterium]|nr:preprotein translocase subunit SecY [Candidatus Saccharibacteria bacterium]
MNWKTIGSSLKNADMRKRIFAVLGMLLVFRFMAHIPIPLSDPETLKQVLENAFNASQTSQLVSFINVISGGALANFSIMLVGMGPYINASIILQLLTRAIPRLEALNKEGEYGRKKINQYTRMLAFPLAIIQSVGMIFLVKQVASSFSGLGDITAGSSIAQWVLMIAALTGGSMILMWLGELITEKGVGNGISLIITIGIVSSLPSTISDIFKSVYDPANPLHVFGKQLPFNRTAVLYALAIAAVVMITTWLVVKINEASRNITINYAKRVQGSRAYGGVTTRLPIKLITAGVIPIIFAVAFLSIPSYAGQVMVASDSLRLQEWGVKLTAWFQNPSAQTFAVGGYEPYIYPVVYFILVVMFTYFYTGVTFNSKEISENLQKQGGFIAEVRAGKQTEKYLSQVVNRLTLFGSFALGLLAITPIAGQAFLKTNIAIGGTSILILVSVALETLRAVESRALMVTYDQYSEPSFFGDDNESELKKSRFRLRRKATKKLTDKTKLKNTLQTVVSPAIIQS